MEASRQLEPDSITRNAAFALAVQLTSAVFTTALTLFLVRALGPKDYGIYALAISIGTVLLLLADLGLSQSAARFAAEHRATRSEVRSVLFAALRLKLLVAFVVGAVLLALAGPLADAYDIPDLAWPLRAMALALLGQSMFGLFASAFEALGRVSLSLRIFATESLLETGSAIGLVLLGGGAAGAVFGRAAGFAVATAFGVVLLGRLVGWPRLRSSEVVGGRRRIAVYAAALFVIEGAITLFNRIDVLLIGAYIGATSAGLFEAPLRVALFLQYFGTAVAAGVAPRMTRGPGDVPNVAALARATRYLVIFQVGIVVAVTVWARPVVDLVLGSDYGDSVGVLRALAPYIFLSGVAALVTVAVNYLGEARRRIPAAVAAVLVNLIIDMILIPRMGIVAGAIGSGVAFAIYVPAHFWILREEAGMPLRPVVVAFVRSLLAAAPVAAVLAAFGTTDLSAPQWVLGSLCGVLVYCLALIAVRELTVAELAGIRRAVVRRMRSSVAG
jgi:O-antigen/teichoic acid export membrane protein